MTEPHIDNYKTIADYIDARVEWKLEQLMSSTIKDGSAESEGLLSLLLGSLPASLEYHWGLYQRP